MNCVGLELDDKHTGIRRMVHAARHRRGPRASLASRGERDAVKLDFISNESSYSLII